MAVFDLTTIGMPHSAPRLNDAPPAFAAASCFAAIASAPRRVDVNHRAIDRVVARDPREIPVRDLGDGVFPGGVQRVKLVDRDLEEIGVHWIRRCSCFMRVGGRILRPGNLRKSGDQRRGRESGRSGDEFSATQTIGHWQG